MSATNVSGLARASSHDQTATKVDIPAPRRRWLTRIGIPFVVVIAVAALLGGSIRDNFWPATPVRVVPVIVKTDIEAQPTGGVIVQAPGWVEADPFPIAVSALADGVVSEVLVLEGETIKKDQIVAKLVDEDAIIEVDRTSALLAEADAALAATEAVREEAQRNWDHPIELIRVRDTTAAMLAEKRAELARWPSELQREEAKLVYLEAEYNRVKPLGKAGHASDIEIIRVKQDYEAEKAEVETFRAKEPILRAQIAALEAEHAAAVEDLELRIADTRALAEAKAALKRAEASVRTAKAMQAEAKLRLFRMDVRSPADGIIMNRLVEPGSKVMRQMDNPASAWIVRLYDPQRLQVRVDIPLVEAAKVGVGQPAEVIVDVLPDRAFKGRLSRVVHEADVQKNTLQVKVAIENPSPELKPEMLARARFLGLADATKNDTSASMQRLFVPEEAILEHHGSKAVWIADQSNNVARMRHIQTGTAKQKEYIEVIDGIAPGDRVIIDAPADISDGDRIEIREAK